MFKRNRALLKTSICFAGKFYIKQQSRFLFVVTIYITKFSELGVVKNKETERKQNLQIHFLPAHFLLN